MAANTPTLPVPALSTPPTHRRLTGALKAGTATANGVALSEVIALGPNVRFLTIRALLATAGGSLAFDFVAPNATTDAFYMANGGIDPTKVTKYNDTLTPAAATITAGTTCPLQVTCNGELFGVVTVTPSGTGTITGIDIAAL